MRPLALPLLAAFSLLSSCATYTISISNSDVAYGVRERSETVRLDLDCPENATVLEVGFARCCEAGSAEFTLRDPAGEVVWHVLAGEGKAEKQGRLAAIAGRWRCEIVLDGFSGDYAVELSAHDGPAVDLITGLVDVRVGPADRRETSADTGPGIDAGDH